MTLAALAVHMRLEPDEAHIIQPAVDALVETGEIMEKPSYLSEAGTYAYFLPK